MSTPTLAEVVRLVARTAVEHRTEWNALDAAVGDGDFGTTAHRGFAAVLASTPDHDDPASLLRAVAEILSRETGGSSGPLWTIGLFQAAQAIDDDGGGVGAPLLVLVTGLGGTTLIEQYVLFGELHARLTRAGHRVARSLVGPYLTALDMPGAVLTVALFDEELTALWDAPVATAGLRWGA